MKFARLLLAFSVTSVACGGDKITAPVTIGPSGTLSLSYTGAGSATPVAYSATGAVPADQSSSFGSAPWAAGSLTSGELSVVASLPRTSSTWDVVVVTVTQAAVGTINIAPGCTIESSTCTTVGLLLGASQSETVSPTICVLTTGTITIASMSSTRAAGSFSGTGTCVAPSGASTAFTVTGGTFDVGLGFLVF